MLGFLFSKKTSEKKTDLNEIASKMKNLFWNAEVMETKKAIVVHGKYNNQHKTFNRLFIHFLGDQKIEFKDERGEKVTHIPAVVDQKDMYSQVKNIMNVF